MQPTKTTIRRLACTAGLLLAALAASATGAAGGSGTNGSSALDCNSVPAKACMTDQEYRALMIRSRALNRTIVGANTQTKEFVPGVTDFPSRLGEHGERAADDRLAQGSVQGFPVYVQAEKRGFDLSAAAIGALAATLLLLGTALSVRLARRTRVAVS